MKTTPMNKGGQGHTTSDRAFHSVQQDKKQHGVSNSGGQESDETSNRDTDKSDKKKFGHQDEQDISNISEKHLKETGKGDEPDMPASGGRATP